MHDPRCPLDGLPEDGCAVCPAIRAARAESYARGWLDAANGRPATP